MKKKRESQTSWVNLGIELAPHDFLERTHFLKNLNSPGNLKTLSIKELDDLCWEIRGYIVSVISRNGGHLASSLGAVELIVALHRVFNAPEDTIIFDVGHQAYAHKIITERKEKFPTIRKFGGLAPFVSARESKYDEFTAGHTSTSLSLASGVALSKKLRGEKSSTVAVIGDGAMTAGMAWEALNFISHRNLPVIIVLNDNRMSIAKNVGGISRYLRRLERNSLYLNFKKGVKKLSGRKKTLSQTLHSIKSFVKSIFIPPLGTVFEELGFRYIGIVDGHDLKELIPTFESVKNGNLTRPVIVHVSTIKGKGLKEAEEDPEKHHGVSSKFYIALSRESNQQNSTQQSLSMEEKYETRKEEPSFTEIFSRTLEILAHEDPRVCGITAAMPEGTGLKNLIEKFPERFWDVGIAEQHAVTLAAALAKRGLKPFVAIYSTFLQRAVDQIIHDVSLDGYPVRFMIDRSGVVGEDGPTHHGLYDEAFLRTIPGVILATARDADSLIRLITTAYFHEDSPIAIRYHRGKVPRFEKSEEFQRICQEKDFERLIQTFPPYRIGEFELLKSSNEKKLIVVSAGRQVHEVLKALEKLSEDQKEKVGVADIIFVKPVSEELIELTASYEKVFVVMESTKEASATEAVLTSMIRKTKISSEIHTLSFPDEFIEHGDVESLKKKYGLDSDSLVKRIRDILES